MIRALEEHLAAWMGAQVLQLSAQSGLFGLVRTQVGDLELPTTPPLALGEVAVLVKAERLVPAIENRAIAPAPVTAGTSAHMQVRLALRILGETAVLGGASGRQFQPSQAHVHRVDLVALALLSLLREQPGPAPDLPEPQGLDAVQGAHPQGAASAAQGARQAHLYWTALEAGEATVDSKNSKNLRQWDIPLVATCSFHLSPAALDGGRILQIDHDHGGGLREAVIYAAAEAIPLDHFTGLAGPVLSELSERGVTALGELGRLGVARVTQVAAGLRMATAGDRIRLVQLAQMVEARMHGGEPTVIPVDPAMLALPARALVAPTADEAEIVSAVVTSPEVADRLGRIAIPVVNSLKSERQESVKVGTLLKVGR